jgi:hypothetical protein
MHVGEDIPLRHDVVRRFALRQGMAEVDSPSTAACVVKTTFRAIRTSTRDAKRLRGRIVLDKHWGVLARLSSKNHRICCLRFHHAKSRYIWWE